MTQTLYAHMNKIKIKKKKEEGPRLITKMLKKNVKRLASPDKETCKTRDGLVQEYIDG
jgi:hypothetical protein